MTLASWAFALAFASAFGVAFYKVFRWTNRPPMTKQEAMNAALCVFIPLFLLSIWNNYNLENPAPEGVHGYGPPDN